MDEDFSYQPPPSPDEIRLRCLEIQSRWTESERLDRAQRDAHKHPLMDADRQRGIEVERAARELLRERGRR